MYRRFPWIADVVDLIIDIIILNDRINDGDIDLFAVNLVAVDKKEMYPATTSAKIHRNLRAWAILPQFMPSAQGFINKYSFFYVGEDIYQQPDEAILRARPWRL